MSELQLFCKIDKKNESAPRENPIRTFCPLSFSESVVKISALPDSSCGRDIRASISGFQQKTFKEKSRRICVESPCMIHHSIDLSSDNLMALTKIEVRQKQSRKISKPVKKRIN